VSSAHPPTEPESSAAAKSGTAHRWRRRAAEALVLLLLVLGIRAWQQSSTASGPAPALAGELLNGKPLALAAFAGRPVLVHFWATWCPICRLEQDSIDALARDMPVITVAMQSGDRDAVIQHLRKETLSFPVLNDPDGVLAAQWGVRAVPASFIVDGAGQIRFVEIGYTTGVGLRLRLWLAGL
jgi:thiol-disulfide isomerase/thioredoxin